VTGTFTQGKFQETYQLQQGFCPATFSTGPSSATVMLQYCYRTRAGRECDSRTIHDVVVCSAGHIIVSSVDAPAAV
jgi:hypothetical protein